MLLSLNNQYTNETLLEFEILRKQISEEEEEVNFFVNLLLEDFTKSHIVVLQNNDSGDRLFAFDFEGRAQEKCQKNVNDETIIKFPFKMTIKSEVAALMIADFIEILQRCAHLYSMKDKPNE